MDITNETLYGTRYVDASKTLIAVELEDPITKEHSVMMVGTQPDNPSYKQLLDIRTIEQLEDSHNNWVDQQSLEDTRMRAWLEGYRFTPDQLRTIASGQMPVDLEEPTQSGFTWIQLINNNVEEDELFKLKLELFEKEEVQNSKKAKQKANLRKAETVVEAFYHYASIIGEVGK